MRRLRAPPLRPPPNVRTPASFQLCGRSKGRGRQKPWRCLETPQGKAGETPRQGPRGADFVGRGPPAQTSQHERRRQASPRPWGGGLYGLKAERVLAKQVQMTSSVRVLRATQVWGFAGNIAAQNEKDSPSW